MSLARSFINFNRKLSNLLDEALPGRFRIDGNADFKKTFVKKYLHPDATIYDVGGGKQPFVSGETKDQLNLHIVGIDISEDELLKAPPGAYDRRIAHDIALYQGRGDADILICQAVLEHVKDVEGAFRAIASCLNGNGVACIFVPSRNAVFARLNLMLPQKVKEFLLVSVYPTTRAGQGFPSFYNKCTPADFARLAQKNGLAVVEVRHYYVSKYFSFFVPLYALWRLWLLCFFFVKGTQAAETFSVALRKR
jgi:2-polyprenyl-6-hydroxyphenyl methylase/3-demethylubiquinone-9 3-methyltransferase